MDVGRFTAVLFISVLILGILACYLFLPFAAPFIVLYLLCLVAWLARRDGRVDYFVELISIPASRISSAP